MILPSTPLPATTRPQASSHWKLVWSDEFNHGAAPDPVHWRYETGYVRNHEAQYYTDNRRQNARLENGCLIIEARKERLPVPGHPGQFTKYTSASLETTGDAQWQYGRFEIRAKLPGGRGTWPAIWLMPDRSRVRAEGGWPACGEIDLMENVGFEPGRIHGSFHTKKYNWVAHTEKTAILAIDNPEQRFHLYAMQWTPDKIDLLVDGHKYITYTNDHQNNPDTWPFDQPLRLKLNLAIGGDWGGQHGIDDAIFPRKFIIDYVRVYQRAGR